MLARSRSRGVAVRAMTRTTRAQVIKKVRTTDPEDDSAWNAHVEIPALLLDQKMALLSQGWDGGLIGVGGSFCLAGLGFFTIAINAEHCGWHYGWKSNRFTTEQEHTLTTLVLQKVGDGSRLRVVASMDSPSFRVVSGRRVSNTVGR